MLLFTVITIIVIIIMIDRSYDVLHTKQKKTNLMKNIEPNPNTLSLRRFLPPPPMRGHICTQAGQQFMT